MAKQNNKSAKHLKSSLVYHAANTLIENEKVFLSYREALAVKETVIVERNERLQLFIDATVFFNKISHFKESRLYAIKSIKIIKQFEEEFYLNIEPGLASIDYNQSILDQYVTPNFAIGYYWLANTSSNKSDQFKYIDQSLKYFSICHRTKTLTDLKAYRDAVIFKKKCIDYINQGVEYLKLLQLENTLLSSDEDVLEYYIDYGDYYFVHKDFKNALLYYNKTKQYDHPLTYETLEKIADCLLILKQYKDANQTLDIYISWTKENDDGIDQPNLNLAYIYQRKAEILTSLGNQSQACNYVNYAMDIYEDAYDRKYIQQETYEMMIKDLSNEFSWCNHKTKR